jgi:uncharacterized protein YndB with AHSA1/START domain
MPDQTADDLRLTCRRVIAASPEAIYRAWLNPEMMIRFMSPGPDMHVSEARSDARPGGRFYICMEGEKSLPHEGTYRELTPFSRIVFTWEAPWSAPGTEVELQLVPVAEGTEVVLTQTRFNSEELRDGHLKGWTGILGKLAGVLEIGA